jgi:ubiquinone/menaquinone biosynthesis C-methylase UbiE
MTFTVGVAQDLRWPDGSFDVVTCTLAMHHIPRRQRPAAFAEIYRVTKPGGRLLAADMAPLLHFSDRLTGSHPAGPGAAGRDPAGADPAWTDPLGDLAAAAGFQIESFGKLPLLHYIVATRPQASRS